MDVLQAVWSQEQQAVSLVALGLVTMMFALTLSKRTGRTGHHSRDKRVFWISQGILGGTGGAVILWPALGIVAVAAATAVLAGLWMRLRSTRVQAA